MAEVVHGMPKSHPSPFALKYGTITTTREQSLPIVLGLYRLTAIVTTGSLWSQQISRRVISGVSSRLLTKCE